MISYEDCAGLSGLDTTTIDTLAQFDHLPAMVALEKGAFIVSQPDGLRALRQHFQQQLRKAEINCRAKHAAQLRRALTSCSPSIEVLQR